MKSQAPMLNPNLLKLPYYPGIKLSTKMQNNAIKYLPHQNALANLIPHTKWINKLKEKILFKTYRQLRTKRQNKYCLLKKHRFERFKLQSFNTEQKKP